MANRIVKTDYEARKVGKPKGTIMDAAEFDRLFENADRAPLNAYEGGGAYEVTEHVTVNGVQLRKGETYHLVRNSVGESREDDTWLVCRGKSRDTVACTLHGRRFIQSGILKKVQRPTSEAQKRAAAKWNAKSTKVFSIRLNKETEADLIGWLESQQNKNEAIKSLIRKAIK